MWKQANVTPLFKKDDPSVFSNYGQVALVKSWPERIVFKHLYNFIHRNIMFCKYQAGFLQGHSTVFQLLETYDHIVWRIVEGKSCCTVFPDLIGTKDFYIN